MPVSVQWDDEAKTILRYTYQGQWTWQELYTAANEGNAMIEDLDYNVSCIIDLSSSRILPQNALVHGKNLNTRTPRNVEMNVVVGANALVRSVVDAFMRVYSSLMKITKVRFAANLDEARAIIARVRAAQSD